MVKAERGADSASLGAKPQQDLPANSIAGDGAMASPAGCRSQRGKLEESGSFPTLSTPPLADLPIARMETYSLLGKDMLWQPWV